MAGTQRTGTEHLAEGSVSTAALPAPSVGHIMRRYYTVWSVYSLANGFLFGVYPLFLRARGLNQFEMNSVLATYFAVTFLTDVPTGAFADALGRRRSFVLGCLIRVTAFMIYFFAHAYPVFLIAESIDGIGTTFCNGAIDAWGVDALDEAGFAGMKDRLFSRISQLMNVGFMISALIGTYVADVNIAWPWLMSAAGYGISAIVGASLMRERAGKRAHVEFAKIPAQVIERVVKGFRRGFRSRTILMLSLANGIFFAASAPYWLEWPQYVNDSYGLGIWVVGWVYCLLTIGRLAGAEIVMRMRMDEAARSTRLIILIAAASLVFFAGGATARWPDVVVALFFLMNILIGAMMPMMQSWFNEQIASDDRATLLSFNSTFATMGAATGLLSVGAYADVAGIPATWKVCAVIFLAAMPCYWLIRPRALAATIAGAAK
ncbi:MAG TPA: MFS transporter [Candidatus Binataceae bacterium]|nr:MFS transporter [Candidatus Binataceae bacterium]